VVEMVQSLVEVRWNTTTKNHLNHICIIKKWFVAY
jgi:hypothetical protein